MAGHFLFLIVIFVLFSACSRKTLSEAQIRADERRRIEQQNEGARTPKARTIAAWKALQAADYAASEDFQPEPDFTSLLFYRPALLRARKVAQSYSQIELEGVDKQLIEHVEKAAEAYRDYADRLEKTHAELVTLAEGSQHAASASRKFGEFVTALVSDGQHRLIGGDVGEFLHHLTVDSDFQRQTNSTIDRYEDDIYRASKRCRALATDATELSRMLTEKYGVPFTPRDLLKTYYPPGASTDEKRAEHLMRLNRLKEQPSSSEAERVRKLPPIESAPLPRFNVTPRPDLETFGAGASPESKPPSVPKHE